MRFQRGEPRLANAGRRAGTPNKIARRIKDVLETVLAEPESEVRLRALRDSDDPSDRATFWRIAGRLVPVEVAAKVEGTREVVHRIHLGPKPESSDAGAQGGTE